MSESNLKVLSGKLTRIGVLAELRFHTLFLLQVAVDTHLAHLQLKISSHNVVSIHVSGVPLFAILEFSNIRDRILQCLSTLHLLEFFRETFFDAAASNLRNKWQSTFVIHRYDHDTLGGHTHVTYLSLQKSITLKSRCP